MGKTSILIADDLSSMRLTLGAILEDKGLSVVTVEDGYRAIEASRNTRFNIMFIDIKMPGINGVQTYREIKKINPEATVIMMTAYSMEDLVKEALEEGAYAVVYKPFDVDRIVAMIDELLGTRTLILVVDDHFDARETLKQLLESRKYRVATAQNGAEAVAMVKSQHYDVILLDVEMPGMSGIETFEQVKQADPEATVIMMTSDNEANAIESAARQGAYACLHKPFDMAKVVELVEAVCQEKTE